MSKNAFAMLLTAKPEMWKQPMASTELDKALALREIQKGIAQKKENLQEYAHIENNIVSDYVQLIENKLLAAFLKISMNDFAAASGFGNPAKASEAVKNYSEVHTRLSFFVKDDIKQHKGSPDAQLSAFRRWISVSSMLLQNGSYEGFQLVFTNLQTLVTPQLEHGLPLALLKEYNRMCQLNSPYKNSAALRHYIEEQQHENRFTPLLFRFRDINTLNESMEQTQDKKALFTQKFQTLNSQLSKLTEKMAEGKDSEVLKELLAEKQTMLERFQRRIKRAEKVIQDHAKKSYFEQQVQILNGSIDALIEKIAGGKESEALKERLEEKQAKLVRIQTRLKNAEKVALAQASKSDCEKKVQILGSKVDGLTQKVTDGKEAEVLKELLTEKQSMLERFQRSIKKADKVIQDLEKARMLVLVSIANEKAQMVVDLPDHLKETYSKVCESYKSEEELEKEEELAATNTSSAPNSPRGHKREKTSTLYSEKMLPGFFTIGKSSNKVWEEVYQPRPRGVSI